MLPRINRLFHIVKSTKNWPQALLVWFGLKRQCTAIFRNGRTFYFHRTTWREYVERAYLFSFLPNAVLTENEIRFRYDGKDLVFKFGKWGFNTILEIFGGDPYGEFLRDVKLKDRQVVDVGAAFGDTPIYFLLRGAKHVYAFEALPSYFNLAKENIRINGFDNRCNLELSAIAGKQGTLSISPDFGDMLNTEQEHSGEGVTVPMVTLSNIVDRFKVTDAFLKMDVEGYEYEIILNTPPDALRRFSDMLIEYHHGHERLSKYLTNAGFETSHTHPHRSAGENGGMMEVGYVIAKLKNKRTD